MPDDAGQRRAANGDRFVVRGYERGDEAAILDLFARSFPHAPRSLAHWRWKFQDDPAGREHISLAFDDERRLVGHYAGYPIAFVDGDRDVVAHQVGDTMTDVAVRHVGRGPSSILGRTALHFYEHFCDGRVAFNYGFNVANIQRFSLKFLRSDRVEPVAYHVRDLTTHPLRPLSRFGPRLRGWTLELVREVGEEFDDLFRRVRGDYGLLARRDARYLRWRYLDCPDVAYIVVAIRKWGRLVGWSVFRLRENRLAWGDALFDPKHLGAVEVLLRHVVPRFPVDAVEGWFAPRPAFLSAQLARLGFATPREPQDLSLMCVPFVMSGATEIMRQRLFYTWGDSDLF